MRTSLIIILTVIFFSLFVGCKKIIDPEPFFTFGEIGNEWTYQSIIITNKYPEQNDTISKIKKLTITDKNDEDMYTFKIEIYENIDSLVSSYFEEYYITSKKFGKTKYQYFVKKRSKTGDTNNDRYYVLGVDVQLSILNNTLNCFLVDNAPEIDTENLINYFKFWINNNYGIVKETYIDNNSETINTLIETNF